MHHFCAHLRTLLCVCQASKTWTLVLVLAFRNQDFGNEFLRLLAVHVLRGRGCYGIHLACRDSSKMCVCGCSCALVAFVAAFLYIGARSYDTYRKFGREESEGEFVHFVRNEEEECY